MVELLSSSDCFKKYGSPELEKGMTLWDVPKELEIGSWYSGVNAVTGYIDEFRIRKEAMYDGDFTPPSSAFTF